MPHVNSLCILGATVAASNKYGICILAPLRLHWPVEASHFSTLSLLTLQNPSPDASPVGERINYAQWSWAFAHCCWSQSKCKKNAAYEIGMSKDEAQVDRHSDPH
jgi:hypothetical protein